MSDKSKKFNPSVGYMVAVHQNIVGIRALAGALDMFPEKVGEALEMAGFQLVADPFDLSADATKVIKLQEQRASSGLQVVREDGDESGSDTTAD